MYRIQFNPKLGGVSKSDHAKMLVFIGIYSVFRGSVDHGGGVSIYIYVYTYFQELHKRARARAGVCVCVCVYVFVCV